jgi:uncharacterized membrane protein
MNKREFLKKLDKKLQILNEEERKDIINEYTDIIDNKVNDGKTEEEAVLEFGSVDVLVNEILEAYKINVKYNDETKEESFMESFDSIVKKGAHELSEFSKDAYEKFKKENKNVKIEHIFEIFIKILVVLILLMIPFSLLKGIGYFISRVMFAGFFSGLINFIWDLLVGIIFFVVTIFVGYTIVKNTLEDKNKGEIKVEKKVIKKESKAETKVEVNDVQKVSVSNILMNIIKIFVVFWSLPFVFMVGLSYIALSILIFGMTKGLMLYGFLLIVIAAILFFQQLLEVIYTLLFKNKLASLYPFILSLVLFVVGGFMSVDYLINIKYYTNYVPEDKYQIQINNEEFMTMGKQVYFNQDESSNHEIIIDNNLPENVISVSLNYYSLYVINPMIMRKEASDKITFDVAGDFELNGAVINDFIDNLKDNTIYNINELKKIDVEIKANESTATRITILK